MMHTPTRLDICTHIYIYIYIYIYLYIYITVNITNRLGNCYLLQGRIHVRLWGGGEFQLVELMYILGENKNEFGGTYLQQLTKLWPDFYLLFKQLLDLPLVTLLIFRGEISLLFSSYNIPRVVSVSLTCFRLLTKNREC